MRTNRLFRNAVLASTLLLVSGFIMSCEKESLPEAPPQWEQTELYGTYNSEYDKWDLESESTFYPILESGDFDYDNTITAMEFCTAYADAYNAANPGENIVAEDVSYNYYDETRYDQFIISETEFQMVRCVEQSGTTMRIYEITGTYEYNKETREFLIHDVSVEDDPRDIKVKVENFSADGKIALSVRDLYWWCAVSFDGKTEYLPSCNTTYYNNKVVM